MMDGVDESGFVLGVPGVVRGVNTDVRVVARCCEDGRWLDGDGVVQERVVERNTEWLMVGGDRYREG